MFTDGKLLCNKNFIVSIEKGEYISAPSNEIADDCVYIYIICDSFKIQKLLASVEEE